MPNLQVIITALYYIRLFINKITDSLHNVLVPLLVLVLVFVRRENITSIIFIIWDAAVLWGTLYTSCLQKLQMGSPGRLQSGLQGTRPLWARAPGVPRRTSPGSSRCSAQVHSLLEHLILSTSKTGLDHLLQDLLKLLSADLQGPDGPTGVLVDELLLNSHNVTIQGFAVAPVHLTVGAKLL